MDIFREGIEGLAPRHNECVNGGGDFDGKQQHEGRTKPGKLLEVRRESSM